ncbi:MAG: hypothetical protein ACREIC_15075, partial [Limisphaerales bacterium]
MSKTLLLSLSLLLAAVAGHAQTADDYFHRGAQLYIWGKKKDAQTQVLTGLQQFPSDPQLNA